MSNIGRRDFFKRLGVGAAALYGLQAADFEKAFASELGKRPNIVFIVADDQRYDMLSCTGNPYAQTPHLDRLASEGMRFDRACVSTAICMPSRASFFTGKNPHNCGAPTIIHRPYTFERYETPFPARLHEAGYHTAHFGKWHLGEGQHPKPGYDHWAGYYACSPFHNPTIRVNDEEKQYEGYTDFIVSQMAADHIAQCATQEAPFFIFLGLAAPHLNFGYPAKYEHIFDGIDIVKPGNWNEDYSETGKAPYMKDFVGLEEFEGGLPLFGNDWERYVKSYYRSSQSIDESVGKVLAALDAAGVADDTLVIYTSDHGYSLGEHGLTEKHFAYEGVLRVPMLVRYPGVVEPGTVNTQLVSNLDVAPTCLDLCGLPIPEDVEGMSWRPILEAGGKPAADWRAAVFYYLESMHMALRTDRYKLIVDQRNNPDELYDLETDPAEMHNLASDPAFASVLADLHARLNAELNRNGLTKRIDHPIVAPLLLGPVPAEDEALVAEAASQGMLRDGERVTVGETTYTWRQVKMSEPVIPISELVRGNGEERFLLAFKLEQLSERDPFTRVFFSQDKPELRGWVNGELLYNRRTEAHPAEIGYNRLFNPPLHKGVNKLVFAGRIEDFPESRVTVMSWEGKTRLAY